MLSSLPKASIFLAKSPCRQSKWSRFHPPAVKFDPIFWAGLLSDSPGKRPLKLQTGWWFNTSQHVKTPIGIIIPERVKKKRTSYKVWIIWWDNILDKLGTHSFKLMFQFRRIRCSKRVGPQWTNPLTWTTPFMGHPNRNSRPYLY
jgi:hypothetical protein